MAFDMPDRYLGHFVHIELLARILLKLDERVQQMLVDEMLTTGHARALLAIENKDEQHAAAVKVFDEKLNVRETEKLVKLLLNPAEPKPEKEKTGSR